MRRGMDGALGDGGVGVFVGGGGRIECAESITNESSEVSSDGRFSLVNDVREDSDGEEE